MVKYIQNGDYIDYLNETGADIPANEVVVLGTDRAGVSEARIPAGEVGTVSLVGVYEFPAEPTDELPQGTPVGWEISSSLVKFGVSPTLGMVAKTKKASENTVWVRLE